MELTLIWPHTLDLPYRENFYLGGWHPNEFINLKWTTPPSMVKLVTLHGDNWFLLSNTSSLHPHEPGLIHTPHEASENTLDALAFRGYILDPPIHSYSPPQNLVKYWQTRASSEHNGVFSAVCIRDHGQTLELINDAFGIAPLYYRKYGELILFATNPRYLTSDTDEPDYMAWRCLIQSGFIAADRTLSSAIKRIPAGCALRFRNHNIERQQWFDYANLPDGTQKIDEKAIAAVEEVFQSALSHCLQLSMPKIFLPLSSGYDSRRILTGLIQRNAPFEAGTVYALQNDYRDLDAQFASLMAKDFGFPHFVIDWLGPSDYAHDDSQRRILLDAETEQHTWAMELMRSLPDTPTLFFDGLGGDVLGNAQFILPGALKPGLYITPETDKRLLAQYTVTNEYDAILHPGKWPSAPNIQHDIISYLESLPSTMNIATIAKLLLRTRRAVAPWAQQMLPAGHIVVCPFLDLEYVRTTLAYHPAEKYQAPFQKTCLKQYWPQYFQYPGTKAIPADMPPGSPLLQNERDLACFHQLQKELQEKNGMPLLKTLLTNKGKIRFWLVLKNDRMALRSMWIFRRFMDIVATMSTKDSCWNIFPQ